MKIVVADPNLLAHRDRFEAAIPPGSDVSWHDVFDEGNLTTDLRDADVYVGSVFTDSMRAAAQKLRLVHAAGAGVDQISTASPDQKLFVANTFHHEESLAEYVVATAVALRRGLFAADKALRNDVWATSVYNPTMPQPNALRDARIGFVGFGHIGRRTWRLFQAFGSSGAAVTGRGSIDAETEGLRWAADASKLAVLLRESDIVVVSAPLNDRTEGMIGPRELSALGAGGILINVGRGPLVQERAVFDALSSGTIAGAAIDVWYAYPGADGHAAPSALPFRELPNLIMTPHSSGITAQTFRDRTLDIADNICRLDRGEPLRNVVAGPIWAEARP
jgi:phosphoglycerate dehydrogenase-like enzyme